jgi:uncharacterized protein (TIGR03085 family)
MVLREHFTPWSKARMAREKDKGFNHVVNRLRAGPWLVPWRLPWFRKRLNGPEFLIHHEDVRRANGQGPRKDRPDLQSLAWWAVPQAAKQVQRAINPYGLTVKIPDDAQRTFGGSPSVTVEGEAVELLLFLSGRRSAGDVMVSGDQAGTAKLTGTSVTWFGR